MKILQVHLHVLLCLLVLSLFKTSSADSQCSYYYDQIPPQTINCDPKGRSIRLTCIVLVSHDYPTSVKWFWNQAGPATSPGINEALNASDKYKLTNMTTSTAHSDDLFGDLYHLTIINFTIAADSGYYWCQIVVNGTVLLQPPRAPPFHVNSSLAGVVQCRNPVHTFDLIPDQCADCIVELIHSSYVRPVSTHMTIFMNTVTSIPASSVLNPSLHSMLQQQSARLTAITPSSSIFSSTAFSTTPSSSIFSSSTTPSSSIFSSSTTPSSSIFSSSTTPSSSIFSSIASSATPSSSIFSPIASSATPSSSIFSSITSSAVALQGTPDVTDPSSNDMKSIIIAAVVCALIAIIFSTTTLGLCIYIYCSKKRKKVSITDNHTSNDAVLVSTQLELQGSTTTSLSVPDFVDERPSIYDDEESSTQRQAPEPYYTEVGPSARHTPASADANVCSCNNQMNVYNTILDTVKEKDTQTNEPEKVTVESTTHSDHSTEKEYALPSARYSAIHLYDDVQGEGERRPGLTEPEPHYYSVIRDTPSENPSHSPHSPLPPLNTGPARNSVPPCDTRVYSKLWDSLQTVDEKRATTDGGNSGQPFYHTLEGQLVTSATGKEQTPVTKELIPPSMKTPASTRLHDDKDWSHHSPVPAVAKAHPRNDASPSGGQYGEPWSTHNVKQESTKKPAPLYHTLECSTKQSEETTTADLKPAASSGALIPPSTNPPATSMSLRDDKDWSHHSPVPTAASSSSTQYAEPHNVKTMQDSAKKPASFYHTLECSTKQSEEIATVDPKPVMSSGEADSAEMQAHSPGRSDVIFDDPAYLPPNSTFTTTRLPHNN